MEVGEMGKQFSVGDALVAQERTVRRLRARVLRYAGQVEEKAAAVAKIAKDGNPYALNDLGELQQLAAGFDAAIAALCTAHEALELITGISSADQLERQPCSECGGGYLQECAGPPPCDQHIPHAQECSRNAAAKAATP
jgi:hypothetical protein